MYSLNSAFTQPVILKLAVLLTSPYIHICTVSASWNSLGQQNTQQVQQRQKSQHPMLKRLLEVTYPQSMVQCQERACPIPEKDQVPYPVAMVCQECQRYFGGWKFEYCCRCDMLVFQYCFTTVTGMSFEEFGAFMPADYE